MFTYYWEQNILMHIGLKISNVHNIFKNFEVFDEITTGVLHFAAVKGNIISFQEAPHEPRRSHILTLSATKNLPELLC